jgi:hypothetical protein
MMAGGVGDDPECAKILQEVLGGGASVNNDRFFKGVTGKWGDGGTDMFCI